MPESTFCDGVGGNHSHWEMSTCFLYPQEWNWTASFTFRTFWKLNCFPGHISTLMVHLGVFDKTPLCYMAPKWLKGGFRLILHRSFAKMNLPQGARIWTLLTFLCGQFWSKVCRTPHDSMDNLKLELLREWAVITQEVLRASCKAFQGRLKSVIKNKGAHSEWMLLIVIVSLAISPSNKF